MTTVKIGGVPEHFNLPWYTTLKAKAYQKENINLRWIDYHGGTGAMCKALREKEIDLAVILTEGIIKDITEGNPSKIVQVFVQTPLIWGIHVAQHSNFKSIEDIKGRQAAISRYGSGSHLMSFINAKNNDWDTVKDLNFKVVKNLDGAVDALTNNEADYFLWERFTTKPLVDKGIFRHIGNCPTPWPCFVIAARNEFIETESEKLQKILNIINTETKNFKAIKGIDKIISTRYQQKIEDVNEWLSLTQWSQTNITESTVNTVQNRLLNLNIINGSLDFYKLVDTSFSN